MKTLVLMLSLFSSEDGPSERYSARVTEFTSMAECQKEADEWNELAMVIPVDPEFPMPFSGWPTSINVCHEVRS